MNKEKYIFYLSKKIYMNNFSKQEKYKNLKNQADIQKGGPFQ